MLSTIRLITPAANDFPRLLEIWESSVRATHHFLKEENIRTLRQLIIDHKIFSATTLTCAQTHEGTIIGFIGVSGQSLDMLFVDAGYLKHGVGKALILEVLKSNIVKTVDVNEQNPEAIGFYEHFGFAVVGRSGSDGFGNPYPILHMALK